MTGHNCPERGVIFLGKVHLFLRLFVGFAGCGKDTAYEMGIWQPNAEHNGHLLEWPDQILIRAWTSDLGGIGKNTRPWKE
jgi:hypothetical protein